MMTQETLREAVKLAFRQHWDEDKGADAAIATMFERLRTPSEDMVRRLNAACDTPDVDLAWVFPVIATAFQQENSDER